MGQWLTTTRKAGEDDEQGGAEGTHVVWRIGGPGTWDARRLRDPTLVRPEVLAHDWPGETLVLYGEEGTGKRMRARDAARQRRLPLFEVELEEWREVGVLERLALVSRMRAICPHGGCVAIHIRNVDTDTTTTYDMVLTTLVREFRGSDWRTILTLNSGDLGMVRTLLELRGVRASWVAQWLPTYPHEHRHAMVQLALIHMGNLKLGDGSKAQRIPRDVQQCPFALELLHHALRRHVSHDDGGGTTSANLQRIVWRAARTVAWNPWTIFCAAPYPPRR